MFKKVIINGAQYAVSDEGTVLGKSGQIIKQRTNSDGYAVFTAGSKGHRISVRTHQIVGKLFVDNANPQIYTELDHLDNNRMNPAASNLEWVTHRENIDRAIKRGSYSGKWVGSKNPKSKLNIPTVKEIRALYKQGYSQQKISDLLNVPWSTVHNIVTYQTWKNIDQ